MLLVKFDSDLAENLMHTLSMEEVTMSTDVLVEQYFATPIVIHLTPPVIIAQGGVEMNLSNFCPLPLVWAPYFLDFKPPYEVLEMAKILMLAEVAMAKTIANAIPSEYHGMINLLKRYVELLWLVFGLCCGHYEMVVRITVEVNAWQHIFEALTACQIASLLWQIFMDTRHFFSTSINIRWNLP
jgi:hypothetical protein